MSLFEQTPSRAGSRFGKLSTNMFFTRNTAQPKRVRHIEGLNGALICSVHDDPAASESRAGSSLNFNGTSLRNSQYSRRTERLVPPTGFWNTYGVIQDTDRWRQELASLASSSGLGLEKEEQKQNNKQTTADQQHASRSGARYSTRTGRFNEGNAKSRGRTGSKHATAYSDALFKAPENEREMWMLQVLCQLLGTSNLEDVQTWLVSAPLAEKEQARTMIHSALRGLKESERTNVQNQAVDLDSLTNFVEKQKTEEKQASQKYMREVVNRSMPALHSIDEEQQTDINFDDTSTNLTSYNSTTYQRAFQNYNPRSFSSFDTTNTKNDEQIETIQLDQENQERPRSASLTKTPKPRTPPKRSSSLTKTPKPASSTKRLTANNQEKHRVESLQIDDVDEILNKNNNDEQQQQDQERESTVSSIHRKESTNEDHDVKSRKIRELKNKLSRQEEEAKRQLSELQSKQSRLENAIKLLAKQTATYGKRRQQNNSVNEIRLDPPVNNDHQQQRKSLDNQPTRSYSGVWKPDSSILQRLQGN